MTVNRLHTSDSRQPKVDTKQQTAETRKEKANERWQTQGSRQLAIRVWPEKNSQSGESMHCSVHKLHILRSLILLIFCGSPFMQTNIQMDGQTLCEGATIYQDNNERLACYLPHYGASQKIMLLILGLWQVNGIFVTYRPTEWQKDQRCRPLMALIAWIYLMVNGKTSTASMIIRSQISNIWWKAIEL